MIQLAIAGLAHKIDSGQRFGTLHFDGCARVARFSGAPVKLGQLHGERIGAFARAGQAQGRFLNLALFARPLVLDAGRQAIDLGD